MQFVVHKKSTQKQLATERIARQQKDREMEYSAAMIQVVKSNAVLR